MGVVFHCFTLVNVHSGCEFVVFVCFGLGVFACLLFGLWDFHPVPPFA